MKKLLLSISNSVLGIIFVLNTSAQNDSLKFKYGDLIVGEVKSMDKGVLQMETDYSDSDFKIEWKKVIWIKTKSQFLISMEDGAKYYSTLSSVNDSIVIINMDNGQVISRQIDNIVYLNAFKDKFLDRISANIDVGLGLTSAQNLRQFTTRSGIGYEAEKWSTNISFNTLRSTQDETDPIERSEGELNFRYVLPLRFYAIITLSLLSDSEQKLDIRSNSQVGLGKFIIRTNRSYWGAKSGVNRNIERYSNETEDRDSWEGYLGTELNLYDIGDLSLLTSILVYPSFTERGRWRSDSTIDIKYDLPFDFYIKLGGSLNYDNQPAEGASDLGYVLQSGIGWEW